MKFAWRSAYILSLSIFLFMLGCMGPDSRRVQAEASGDLRESQKFVLSDLQGSPLNLSDLLKQKKAVLINFFATWCPPCREEIPDLIQLQEKLKDRSFTILGVDVGESKNKVESFAKKMGINYPIALDIDMKVSEEYSIVGIPTTFLVSSDGKVLGKYHAFTPELVSDIEKALQ